MSVFLPEKIPASMREDPRLTSLVGDLGNFVGLHKVQDKDTKKRVQFVPMPMQEKIFKAIGEGHNRIAVIKARQTTATTGCKMALHHMAYSTPYAAMHAVVSMRSDSASALLDDHRAWVSDLPDLLQRDLKTASRSEITYGDTGASIKAFTSRSTTGLRSFQPIAALISEAAFSPDLAETLAQADAAVGEGLLILESTANSPGDRFSEIIQGAPENGWHVITMWWWEHPAYRDDEVPDDFEGSLTSEEITLQGKYGLDLHQLHWRRRKFLSLGAHKFRREYPANLEDCFLQRKGGYLPIEALEDIESVFFSTPKRVLEAPNQDDYYVIGADPAGGTGGDYSAMVIMSATTRQPVYVERNNQIAPHEFAARLVEVGAKYTTHHGSPLLLVESNNHGHAVLRELHHLRYRPLWTDSNGRPWVTSHPSKIDAYDGLREMIQSGMIYRLDHTTLLELRSLVVLKVSPEAPPGLHDDCAMALALACRCLRDVPASKRRASQAKTMDRLTAQIRARKIKSRTLPWKVNQ